MNYCIYKKSTGQITTIGTCPTFAFLAQSPSDTNLGLVELPERKWEYYIDVLATPHEAKGKTVLPFSINKTSVEADGVDLVSITNLHNPTTVTWPDGEVTIETDGTVSFTIDLAGEYTVKLQAVPFLEEVIHVTATD